MNSFQRYINETTKAAPLAAFRFFFGLLMAISLIRFAAHGWIEKLYILPQYHFSYYGFSWVQPLGEWTYLLFVLCFLSSIAVMIGYKYRLAIISFFLSFCYIELMDKTTYLNHYYFISVVAFIFIFLPASSYFSVDSYRNERLRYEYIPRWCIDALKLMVGIVYFYAGVAKLNNDWMLEALPLKIWLPGSYDLPLIGSLLEQTWVHYSFSWLGMLYDVSIPFLLLYKPTRRLAFVGVIIFHIMTRVLFPIGMFPFIMIFAALIFFDAPTHEWILRKLSKLGRFSIDVFNNGKHMVHSAMSWSVWRVRVLCIFFVVQLLLPWRYLCYPGHLFWTEEGYRFSWRVMLMEKTAYAQFKVKNGKTQEQFYVDNRDFLSSFQEKQMAMQPDMILEYAHYLGDHFSEQGHQHVEVYVDSYASLNGRINQPFIDPNVDLYQEQESFFSKDWILKFKDEK